MTGQVSTTVGWLAIGRLAIGLLALVPSTALADDMFAEARKLYAAAFYERALTALEQINPQQAVELRDQQSIRRYRALCLIALDRDEDAARVVNELVAAEPMASGDPADPPRLRELVHQERLRVVPAVARELYERGRRHFLQKSLAEASSDFEAVVALVDDKSLGLGSREDFADLRLLAQGFLELSRNAAGGAPPAAAPPRAERAPAREKSSEPPEVIPPVAISQVLPLVPYPLRQTLRQPREGAAVEVTVSADGSVQSATLVTPSHPVYDALLLAAAKTWKYRPAMRGGVPVPYKKRVVAVFPN